MARWVKSHNQMRIFKQTATPAVVDGLAIGDLWIDINSGAILKLCTAISPVTFVAEEAIDANGNISAVNFLGGYSTTVTAAATTTLTVASNMQQFFTGSTTQNCKMPVTSTLALGQSWRIVNNSSGVVTVQSSGTNTIIAMAASTEAIITCKLLSGTDAASWDYQIIGNNASITGTGSAVRATSPALVTPTLGAASATSLSFSSTSGIIGSTTNDSAAAGSVGEIVSSVITSGSPTALTSTVSVNVTSISLTAGDWDVFGNVGLIGDSSTTVSYYYGWCSATSATIGADASAYAGFLYGVPVAISSIATVNIDTPFLRISVAGTTTVYLSCNASFAISTMNAFGRIFARRRR